MVAEIAAKVAPEAELHINSEGLYIDPQTDEFDMDGFVEALLTDVLCLFIVYFLLSYGPDWTFKN